MDVYEQLKTLDVFTIEQFLRKKATLKDNDIIGWFRRRVPVEWQQIDVNADLQTTLYTGVVRQKWAAKMVYEFLINDTKHIPKAIGSWSREWANPVSQDLWLVAARAAMRIHDVRSRSFQLMFLNRGYYVNTVLAKFTDISPMCTFCDKEEETYTHLYWSCEKIAPLIQSVKLYCSDTLGLDLELLTRETFLLSAFADTVLVMLTMLVKKYVFKCRIEKTQPTFKTCMIVIRKFIRKDKIRAEICKKSCNVFPNMGPTSRRRSTKRIR